MHRICNNRLLLGVEALALVFVVSSAWAAAGDAQGPAKAQGLAKVQSPVKAHTFKNYGTLPLIFEANHGQTDPRVKFLSRGPGYTLFLTKSEAVLSLLGTKGNAYVTGWSTSTDFPTTENAFQKTIGGKNGREPDAIVAKLNADGSDLDYSTYLGGKQLDYGNSIAIDGDGNAYVTGYTLSNRDFPTTGNAFQQTFGGASDAFVTKINPSSQSGADSLVYSSYLGGSDADSGEGIAAAGGGNAYVVGYSYSSDFPTMSDSYQPFLHGAFDAFVVKVSDAVAPPPDDGGGGKGGGKPCNPKKKTC